MNKEEVKFQWDLLCSPKRLGFGQVDDYPNSSDSVINVFQKDIERVLTSSAFRRLQGKTQVYPFPNSDSIRNRLTHTLEVSYFGRTLIAIIHNRLNLDNKKSEDFQAIVNTACLLHDIGNPPFGHSGESSIREFFSDKDNIQKHALLSKAFENNAYKNDFQKFDGNAHGFRVATSLAGWRLKGGLRLSAASLASMVKYPWSSEHDVAITKGKFGFLQTEAEYFDKVFTECGLKNINDESYYVHPFAKIVEVSDDTAYLTSDLQDAFKNGDIDLEDVVSLLLESINTDKYPIPDEVEYDDDGKVSFMRSAAVSSRVEILQENLVKAFSDRKLYSACSDIDALDASNQRAEKFTREISNIRLYRGKRKMQLQVLGGKIIKSMLELHVSMLDKLYRSFQEKILNDSDYKTKTLTNIGNGSTDEQYIDYLVLNIDNFVSREDAQIYYNMPNHIIGKSGYIRNILKRRYEDQSIDDKTACYEFLMSIVDFISGMTDSYINDYNKNLTGISIK